MADQELQDLTPEELAELQAFFGSPQGPPADESALPRAPEPDSSASAEATDEPTTLAVPVADAAASPGRPPPPPGLTGEASAKVLVEHQDPQAPYLAATTWDELHLPKDIMAGIYEMNYTKPSKIQEWALPIALRGGNIIGQAQNGSGKTAAFALSMLVAVDSKQRHPQGVCFCPTRELATQNYEVIGKLGKFTGIDLFLAVPQPERPPRKVLAQIVVGTPGKLQDLVGRRVIEPQGLRVLVIDEADQMIDESNDMGQLVLAARRLLPEDMQAILFSATWPDRVQQFARSMVPNASIIKVVKEDLTLTTITQTFIDVGRDSGNKFTVLSDLYGALNIGQSIIFVNTRSLAFSLAKQMKDQGHAVSLICGSQKTGPEKIDHAYRDRIMAEFRSGVTKVLISTDVLSRGIDVPAVTLVVNYELPMARYGEPNHETYMHRIGRTGRFGLKGVAVNLVTSQERPVLDSIQRHYKCSIRQLSGDCEEIEVLLRGLR